MRNSPIKLTIFILLASFSIQHIAIAQKNAIPKGELVKILDQQIPQWLEEFTVPGAALALIENGQIHFVKGYGYADVEQKIPVDVHTGFNIGSISKTVAAWGVMKLVEEGKISLDAPVEKYLSRWSLPPSEFDKDGVTPRRLLSHTAGLSLHGYPGWGPGDKLPTIEESLNGKNNGPGDVRIIMKPGTKWKYSGGGYTIMQLVIEEVSGRKFADYMQKNVLHPLGMRNSSYNISEKILQASSKEHDAFGDPIPFEYFTAEAAAGLHTTISDFATFVQANLATSKNKQPGRSVLNPKTVKEMMAPAPASKGSYGLGYSVANLKDKETVLVGHGGANTGWHAYFQVNPATNDGFAVVTNGGSGWNVHRQIYCAWVESKTGAPLKNGCKKSIVAALIKPLKENGAEATVEHYKKLKKEAADEYFFNEGALNQLGYSLLGKDMIQEAIAIFQLNVEEYPKASNPYDSLGEAYMIAGNKELAIKNYKKSLALNPDNQNAVEMLKKLKQ